LHLHQRIKLDDELEIIAIIMIYEYIPCPEFLCEMLVFHCCCPFCEICSKPVKK
jgi:hypothetical protein